MGNRALISILALTLAGCTAGHCRRRSTAPGEALPLESAPVSTSVDRLAPTDRVLVYKYDGSAQCEQGKARTPEQMAKDLKDIPILSMEKRNDGLAHIQVCGQTTGVANVYEISARHLPRAEAAGFKRWTFRSE